MSYLKKFAFAAAATLLLTGCSDENPWVGSEGVGALKLRLQADANVADAVPKTRASESLTTPDVSEFAIRLHKADDSFDKTWSSIDEFNATDKFNTGAYTISASYGDPTVQGFEKPAFYGEATVMVLEGETSQVDVTASLANTMVSLDYSEAFKTFFPDYAAQLHAEGQTDYIDVSKDDANRPVFMTPGTIKISVTLTQPNTGKQTTIQPAEFEALGRHHYHVTLDYNNGGVGQGQFVVTFDDSVVQEDVTIDLTDELFTAPAPQVTASGFVSGQQIEVLQGTSFEQAMKFNVNAAGKIKEANLTINSAGKTFAGGATEINLVTASEADKALLEQWGFNVKGLYKNPDRFAFVDFSEFVKNLPVGTHSISLQVKDVVTHVSEPATFEAVIAPIELTTSARDAIFGDDTVLLDVKYNGSNFEDNISFKVLNNSGNYIDAPIKSVEPKSRAVASNDYVVTITIPILDRAQGKVRTYFRGEQRGETEFNVIMPEYDVQIDAYANYCDVKVTPEQESLTSALTSQLRLFLTGDNQDNVSFTRNPDTGIIRVKNLTAANAYTLKTTLDKSSSPAYNTEDTFTTEAATQVPNGDFSAINENSLNISDLLVGGKFTVTVMGFGTDYYNYSSILRSEPQGWANLNPLTAYAGSSNKNTWFIVPSTWVENGKTVIRSVGYNHAGTTPTSSGGGMNTNYYCENTPGQDGLNKSAGELFLGSYSFDGSAHRTDGIAFASRPASLSFDYTYAPINDEKGVALIKVYNAAGTVIAQNTASIDATSTETRKTVALPAYPFGSKAAKIEVSFKSVNGDATVNIPTGSDLSVGNTVSGNTGYRKNRTLDANSYPTYASGSVLTIDNVALGYDPSGAAAKPARKSAKSNKKSRK